MNYFEKEAIAERYAKGRPHFHSNTIQKVKAFLGLTSRVKRALDVACGTGLSTKALLEIAETVYGTDISEEMLKQTSKNPKISYLLSEAENQPFENDFFDLITVSSGVHWFRIEDFLKECYRLLKPNGTLVIYENHFLGQMEGVPSFREWITEKYLKNYPTPPRNGSFDWSEDNMKRHDFELMDAPRFQNTIEFSRDKLAMYFTTQSNVTAEVNRNGRSYEEIANELMEELQVFFPEENATRTLVYGNWVKYLRKEDVNGK